MKTVLITGASGGIGSAVAVKFAEKGYFVCAGYNSSAEKADKICDNIISEGGMAQKYKCDITSEDDIENMFRRIEKDHGEIDVLVNNAGISQIKLFDEITMEEWNRMIAVNLTSVYAVSRRAVVSMIRRKKGAIVNVSSIWGQTGASCETHYSASKGGVIALTKALAKELAPSGITVNCVCPGAIDTAMNAFLSDEERKELEEEIPVGRLGKPEEVADAVIFSAENNYLTGQIIAVNGGMFI
jgi:3-oxoacyl-[acyl-carrier protein] reductase